MLLWLASFWIVKASAPAFPSRVQNVKATSLLEIKCPADFSHLKPSLTYTPGINPIILANSVAEGKYLVVVQRINGEWKIVADAAVPNPRLKSNH